MCWRKMCLQRRCPRKEHNGCRVVHSSITCDGCGASEIMGTQYKCKVCFDFDLCEGCYRRGVHSKTHAFCKIDRVGVTPTPLPPLDEEDGDSEYSATKRAIQSALLQVLLDGITIETQHCSHCKGGEGGRCACSSGCDVTEESKCTVVHTGIYCDACRQAEIVGTRYKCKRCFQYDLCEGCYEGGKHEKSHSFWKIDRVGSNPVHQEPRL
jgi:hypothetical protein